jgi:hypothetical protein
MGGATAAASGVCVYRGVLLLLHLLLPCPDKPNEPARRRQGTD